MQDDPRQDLEEALRLIKALHLSRDSVAADDADDEAREQFKCENNEKAKHRNAEAKRIAGGWYFVADAASAIAHQQGWDDVTRLKFRSSMMEAAALGSLAVRDRSTRIPIPTGKLSTLACMVAHKDVNLWLDGLGVGYQWEFEPNSLDAGTEPPKRADTQPASKRTAVETSTQREDRRYREFVAMGGDYIEGPEEWRATGRRKLLAELTQKVKDAGEPMSHEKDVREGLKKAATRAKKVRADGYPGSSVFSRQVP